MKDGTHLYFIRKTPTTSVLFESFFLDNDRDNDIGDTTDKQRAFGVAYAKAILEYLGIPYQDAVASKPAASEKLYRVQVGAFRERKNAEKLLADLKADGYDGYIRE